LALVAVGLPAAIPADSAAAGGRGQPVTVMTRNVYLGGSITRPVTATRGLTGAQALLALGHANHELRRIVDRTDFRVRSRLLAAEIAAARPDLLGLQEVALWRRGPLQLDQLGVPNATQVDYDFLALLLEQLRARGAYYRVVVAQTGSDVEAPAFRGDPRDGTATETADVRLTIRDVILVRRQAGLRVHDSGGGQYRSRLDLNLSGVPFAVVRGYTWADVRRGKTSFRFLNTHLESQSSDLALAQAEELLAGPAARAGTTVIACDCNSNPLDSRVRPGSSVPHDAAYRLLTGPGEFVDAWLALRRRTGPGWTSGLSELVSDPAPSFEARIDLLLVRTESGRFAARRGEVTGDEETDRDPTTGLWPSDHAGVVVDLRLPVRRWR